MKAKKYFKNSMKVGVAFTFAAAMTMILSAYSIADNKKESSSTVDGEMVISSTTAPATNVSYKHVGDLSEVACAILKLKEINKEKACIEKKMVKEKENLKKAEAERNKDYGMIAGMYYQPASGLSEALQIEIKIKDLNHQLSELKKAEKAIYEKYGNDIKSQVLV